MSRTNPHHIALFIPSLAGGGAERVTINLARGLIAAGVKTDIVVGRACGPYLKDIPSEARLINLNASRTITALRPLIRYLRTECPDGLISALDHANVVALVAAAISRTKIPVVVATHMHLSTSSNRLPFWKAQLDRCLQRLTYRWALAVVAVSHGVAKDMAHRFGWPVSDIRVIYNPVIGPDLRIRAQDRPSHKWLTDSNQPVIVALGRLTEQKNFSLLLHAVALLKEQLAVKLIILGEGEEREKLQDLVVRLGLREIVDMPGFAGNPYSFMSRASAVALSSRWEALPTVLIEALACGTPVIATNCPAGPDEVLGNGKYGKLVPMEDPVAMASALLDVLKKPTTPAAESWQPYLIEAATQKYLGLFDSVAPTGN